MALANQFVQPMDFYGVYRSNTWAGYSFKEVLGYTSGYHTGVDYNGPGAGNADLGMDIRSIANGIVRWTGTRNDLGYGRMTIIEHQLSPTHRIGLECDSLFSRYMHQNSIDVRVGDEVSIGQKIGTVGNSGTTWAHLHIDLYKSTIDGGGVHFRYDKDTQLQSYLDVFAYIQSNLNPVDIVSSILPYQRVLENKDGVYQRDAPKVSANIIKDWPYDREPFNIKGFVRGEDPYGTGNNIWFVGAYSGGYFWSGAFLNKSTEGLKDLTEELFPSKPSVVEPPVVNDPVVPPKETYVFDKAFDFVTETFPAAIGNFERENFPQNPSGIVIHDFGTAGLNTYQSLKNEFTKAGTEKSIFLAFSKEKIGQNTKLGDRAYHAGPQGNVYYGFEIDPTYKDDPIQIANIRKAIDALQLLNGKKLNLYKHSEFMATSCGDDVDLTKYDVAYGTDNTPVENPDTTDKGNQPSDLDKENNALLKLILSIVTIIKDKIFSIFK